MCQPNTNSFFDINWVSCEKFQPDWPTLRGVLGWSGILWLPRQLHSLNLHFGLDMNFSKNKTIKIHFRGDSCRKQYGFQPWIYLNWEYISISLYSHLWLYFRLPGHIWHIRHHWYIRCNPKTYAIRFSVWQAIFGPNFRLIDQHLVLVWADLHLFFGYFYNNIWVKYFLFRDVMLQMRLKYPY